MYHVLFFATSALIPFVLFSPLWFGQDASFDESQKQFLIRPLSESLDDPMLALRNSRTLIVVGLMLLMAQLQVWAANSEQEQVAPRWEPKGRVDHIGPTPLNRVPFGLVAASGLLVSSIFGYFVSLGGGAAMLIALICASLSGPQFYLAVDDIGVIWGSPYRRFKWHDVANWHVRHNPGSLADEHPECWTLCVTLKNGATLRCEDDRIGTFSAPFHQRLPEKNVAEPMRASMLRR